VTEILTTPLRAEEEFEFPRHASLVATGVGYAMGFMRRHRDTRPVDVDIREDSPDETVIYELTTASGVCHAILLRSAWLRPTGDPGLDGARPLTVRVTVDENIVLEQSVDEHVRTGYPYPLRKCFCNSWGGMGMECRCPATPVSRRHPDSFLFYAARVEGPRLTNAVTLPEHDYGIFAPNGTVVRISLVKVGPGPVRFKAVAGITAALYSTKIEDVEA